MKYVFFDKFKQLRCKTALKLRNAEFRFIYSFLLFKLVLIWMLCVCHRQTGKPSGQKNLADCPELRLWGMASQRSLPQIFRRELWSWSSSSYCKSQKLMQLIWGSFNFLQEKLTKSFFVRVSHYLAQKSGHMTIPKNVWVSPFVN